MGLKSKLFKKKEMTEEQIHDELLDSGIVTKSQGRKRPEKFGAFKQYAEQKNKATENTFTPMNKNPYSTTEMNYDGLDNSAYGEPNPPAGAKYGEPTVLSNHYNDASINDDPYGENSSFNFNSTDSYNKPAVSYTSKGAYSNGNTGHQKRPETSTYSKSNGPVSSSNSATRVPGIATQNSDSYDLDFNDVPTDYEAPNRAQIYKKQMLMEEDDDQKNLDDLNEVPDDLSTFDQQVEESYQRTESDEENDAVELIKQDIRFTKQESLASTRNTIRLAQEAEMSGHNTLGMLGSQSERLFNVENNLGLAGTQTKIAASKVDELKRLNRSIFLPTTSANPFNRKARLRRQEEQIKSEKIQEKIAREHNRSVMYDSEQRIKSGLKEKNVSELHQKYTDVKNLSMASKYQFENDSEDDEIEKELANNLDEIGSYATKLKKLALTAGEEVDRQNDRLKNVEEDTDRLDLNVHMNTARLTNIR